MKKLILLPAASAALFLLAFNLHAQSYSIDLFAISNGGGTSTGNGYSLNGAADQPDEAATMSGGGYTLEGGFQGTALAALPELRITAAERIGNDLRLSFSTVAGQNYAVQSCANLSSGAWTDIPGGSTPGTGGTVQVTVTKILEQSQQFYRVLARP